jgi:hypothetical protein
MASSASANFSGDRTYSISQYITNDDDFVQYSSPFILRILKKKKKKR